MSLLLERLEGGADAGPRRCVMETRLSVRDSCAALARSAPTG